MLTETADNSNTLFSDRYQQTYHSKFGALTESMHVFVNGAGVAERLYKGKSTRILEIGFGLGLNCLLSSDIATTEKTALHYTTIENDLISASQLASLDYQTLLKHPTLTDDLAQVLSQLHKEQNQDEPAHHIAELGPHTRIELYNTDATSEALLAELQTQAPFDAIYLDAFSPDTNPECWTLSFFRRLRHLLATDGQLATYCVKGVVRRNLEEAGFIVEKYPGPTGKREVLKAHLSV